MSFWKKLFSKGENSHKTKSAVSSAKDSVYRNGLHKTMAINGLNYRASLFGNLLGGFSKRYWIEAINVLNRAVDIGGEEKEISFNRGKFAFNLELFDRALDDFKKDDPSPAGYSYMGKIYEIYGKKEAAREAYKHGHDLAKDPSKFDVRLKRVQNFGLLYTDNYRAILEILYQIDPKADKELRELCAYRIAHIGNPEGVRHLCDFLLAPPKIVQKEQKTSENYSASFSPEVKSVLDLSEVEAILKRADSEREHLAIRRDNISFLKQSLFLVKSEKGKQVLRSLLKELTEEDEAYTIAEGLIRNGDPKAQEIIINHAKLGWDFKFKALQWLDRPDMIELYKHLKRRHKDIDIRSGYLAYLARMGGDEAARLLIEELKRLGDKIAEGFFDIVRLMETRSKVAFQYVREHLGPHEVRSVRYEVARAISCYGDKTTLDIARTLLNDRESIVREQAALSLTTLLSDAPEAVLDLEKLVAIEEDQEVKEVLDNLLKGKCYIIT